jgi:hypothetical protein
LACHADTLGLLSTDILRPILYQHFLRRQFISHIIEAASLLSARMGAADSALDEGASFAEGQELDAARSARIPPGYVGMMLSRKEATRLLEKIGGKGR